MSTTELAFFLRWSKLGYLQGTRDMHLYNEEVEKEIMQCRLDPHNPHHLFEFLSGMLNCINDILKRLLPPADIANSLVEFANDCYCGYRIGLGSFVPDGGFEEPFTRYEFTATSFANLDIWEDVAEWLGECWANALEFLKDQPDQVARLDRMCAEESIRMSTGSGGEKELKCEESYCQLMGARLLVEYIKDEERLPEEFRSKIADVTMAYFLLATWPKLTSSIRNLIRQHRG